MSSILLVDQIGSVMDEYNEELCTRLTDMGYEMVLATAANSEIKSSEFKKIECFIGTYGQSCFLKKGINYILSIIRLKELVKEVKPSVVHLQWALFSPIDYLFIKWLNKNAIPVLMTVHDVTPFNRKFYDRFFLPRIYGMTTELVVQSKIAWEELVNICEGKAISLIHHPTYNRSIKLIDNKIAKETLGFSNKTKMILFFGQIKKVKGVEYLLRAYTQVIKEYPDSILVIAGKSWGDSIDKYSDLANQIGIGNHVKWDTRFVPGELVPYYFSAADLVVLPYLHVYQSGVLQLSFAYKRPVVISNIPGLVEYVVDEVTGLVVPSRDDAKLAEAILNLLHDEDLRLKLGSSGHEFAVQNFSWEMAAHRYNEIYSRLTSWD